MRGQKSFENTITWFFSCSNMVIFWQIMDFGLLQQSQNLRGFAHVKYERWPWNLLWHAWKDIYLNFHKDCLNWFKNIRAIRSFLCGNGQNRVFRPYILRCSCLIPYSYLPQNFPTIPNLIVNLDFHMKMMDPGLSWVSNNR